MIPINQDRAADNLPALVEGDSSLTALVQAAADKMARAGDFFNPDFSSARPNTLIVATKLSRSTRINEYAFLLNQSNNLIQFLSFISIFFLFSKIYRQFWSSNLFDNFSNQRYKILNTIDDQRYVCSKNSKIKISIGNWKKYTTYGTGHSGNAKGDDFMAIALTY